MVVKQWMKADGTKIPITALTHIELVAAIRATRREIIDRVRDFPKIQKSGIGYAIIRINRYIDARDALTYEAGARGLTVDTLDNNSIIDFTDVGQPDFSITVPEPTPSRANRSINVQESNDKS